MLYSDLQKELSQNFIEYAAACNSDRAIPDATSGLKPVARRILWSAYESGYFSSKPHVKSARVVGNVIGAYHPHGDSSIYGALVRLSQDWIMRYPLIDWHGNNGNISGDDAAHMRYTEARLAKIAEDGMLAGIKKDKVDFVPNYDETCKEPVSLPSLFPNLLCNPNSGIGVALASNFLPHNLREVTQAILDYLEGKKPTLLGPDFPTGGLIINKDDIPKIMETGHGTVKVRGKYRIEKSTIIFYEIPYGLTLEGILNNISAACDKKEIEGISEIRDESNREGIRIVIECNKEIDPLFVVSELFAKTNLQTSISYNQIGLVNKTPTDLNLTDCIKIYVNHNVNCIVRESNFDLQKAQKRQHIVQGLLKALENIDNIISLIRKSENAGIAKSKLIEQYDFSDEQAQAILDMKLSKLANLEKIELEKEESELENQIDKLNSLIQSPDRQKEELKTRLIAFTEKYGDARRTEIIQLDEKKVRGKMSIKEVELTFFDNGNIRCSQKNGKVLNNIKSKVVERISTNTLDTLIFFTSAGKVYKLPVNKIPLSKEVNIKELFSFEKKERIMAITTMFRQDLPKYAVFITKLGQLKKTLLSEYLNLSVNKGVPALKLKEGDSLIDVLLMDEEEIAIVTCLGFVIRFATDNINPIGRLTLGVRAINLNENDQVIMGSAIVSSEQAVGLITSRGMGKRCLILNIPLQNKGGKGNRIHKLSEGEEIIAAGLVEEDDNIILIYHEQSVAISAKELPLVDKSRVGQRLSRDKFNSLNQLFLQNKKI